jgi:indole-3-glycerol phosphate synthase
VPDIKLYLDEDTVNRALIRALRSRNTDILTAREADLIQVADERHLEHATFLGRTVFTFNARDFARLHTNTSEPADIMPASLSLPSCRWV